MRIAVLGTGGVGGYFGGRLAQAGEEVVFIARGEHLETMLRDGLRVDSIRGDFHLKPVQAVEDPGQAGVVDMVLVAVKAWQVPEIAEAMRPMLKEGTGVVFLGNGVDALAQLTRILGEQHVLGGMSRISSLIAGPGHIRHVGIVPFVAFGELDGSSSVRVERLREAFEGAGVEVSVPDDIQAVMWEKFVFIAAVSGIGGVMRQPIGVIRRVPEARQMLRGALGEVARLAEARRINLPDDLVSNTIDFIDGMAPSVTPSMQRDIMEGRPSELDSQNGAVVRMGLESGVPTPIHTFLYHSLLPQEMVARGQI